MLARNGAGLSPCASRARAAIEGAGKHLLFKPQHTNSQAIYAELFIGGRRTDVTVERDRAYPNMFRVRQGDDLSDITNISRAKDAAISWVRPKGLGGDEVVRWHHRQTRGAASPMRKNGGGHG